MAKIQKITPCLWFDRDAEAAAAHYTSIFDNSRVVSVTRYGEGTPMPKGTAMVVIFELEGQRFMAFNGGPHFKFTEAISMSVDCGSQAEVDRFWAKLVDGGAESRCGWLKDKFGLSWQIVPSEMARLMSTGTAAQSGRVMAAMLGMVKLDIAALQRAFDGP